MGNEFYPTEIRYMIWLDYLNATINKYLTCKGDRHEAKIEQTINLQQLLNDKDNFNLVYLTMLD
jgi:hypothetical protein